MRVGIAAALAVCSSAPLAAQSIVSTFLGGGSRALSSSAAVTSTEANLQARSVSMTIDSAGGLYVARTTTIIYIINGRATVIAGGGTTDFFSQPPSFSYSPLALAFGNIDGIAFSDSPPSLIVLASSNQSAKRAILRLTGNSIGSYTSATRIAGGGTSSGDGVAASAAQIDATTGVAVSGSEIFFSQQFQNRVKSLSNGIINTVAGTNAAGNSGDGLLGVQALLNQPRDLVVAGGFLHITSAQNCSVRRLDLATRIMSTLPGTEGEACGNNRPIALARHSDGVLVGRPGRLDLHGPGGVTHVAGNGQFEPQDGLAPAATGILAISMAHNPSTGLIFFESSLSGAPKVRAIVPPSIRATIRFTAVDLPVVPLMQPTIDGVPAESAAVVPGTSHTVEVLELGPVSATERRRFLNYREVDATTTARRFTFVMPFSDRQLEIVTSREFRVDLEVTPAGGGRMLTRLGNGPSLITTTERTLFFTSGSVLSLTAEPNDGFRVTSLAGQIVPSVNLTVTAATRAVARFVALNGFTPIRINAGGSQFTDELNQTWGADTGPTAQFISTTENISGVNGSAAYETARRGLLLTVAGNQVESNPTFTFNVPDGGYNLRLKFADFQSTAVGQRRFDVRVNGTTVLTNFDIFAEAGGRSKALDKLFSVTPVNGVITVTLGRRTGDPMINALQLISGVVGVTVSPANVTVNAGGRVEFVSTVAGSEDREVTWSIEPALGAISDSGVYIAPAEIGARRTVAVTATSKADPTRSARATIQLSPPWTSGVIEGRAVSHQPLSGDGSVIVRVAAGGPGAEDIAGVFVRESTEDGAPGAFAGLRADRFAVARFRASAGAGEDTAGQGSGMRWVRLTRFGDQFTAAWSLDGVSWLSAPPVTIPMKADAVAGLAMSGSGDPSVSEAFAEASITGPAAVELARRAGSAGPGQQTQLEAAVTGAADTAVTYSVAPAFGVVSSSGVYAAPADAADAPRTVTIRAASLADPSKTASAVLRVGRFEPVAVNAGGTAASDEALGVFSGDQGFTGGRPEALDAPGGAAEMYRTARMGGDAFDYRFTVPSGGRYFLRLHFMETQAAAAGQRVFHVLVNGRRGVEALDVFARAGGANRPLSIVLEADAPEGEIRLTFVPLSGDAMVQGIEVLE